MPTPRVDLYIDGTWTDVSSYVQYSAGIAVKHGRQSESGSMEPDSASLTFLNNDYRFTPLHPLSPYFDVLQRNTLIRITNDAATVDTTESTYMYLPGSQGAYAFAADNSTISITGDIDIRLDVALDDWTADQDLVSKYRIDIPDRSWAINISAGILQYVWSADGSAITSINATAAISANPGDRVAIRVTHDVNNGAAGNDVTFYTSDSISGTWTQLGTTVTTAGTTSIYDSLADLVIGDIPTSGLGPMVGKVYAFNMKSPINSTTKASPDFRQQTDQTTSFTDSQTNTWFVNGAAQIVTETPGPWRFHGEVSNWPVESDITGNLVTVPIDAAGQWRRLSQNEQPFNSVMFRAHTNPSLTRVKAYFSMEDGAEATEIASNLISGTGTPMKVTGSPLFADYSEWDASAPMITLGSASLFGNVPAYTSTGESGVYFFFFTPTAGAPAAECSLFKVYCSGSIGYFDIRFLTNGNLRVKAYDSDGVAIDDGAGLLDSELAMGVFPRGFLIMHLELLQSGSDTLWYIAVNDFTNTDVISGGISADYFNDTITSKTFGQVTKVVINAEQAALTQTHISHLVVSDQFKLTLTDVGDAIDAFNGENPATRILRICGEENIPVDLISQNKTGNSVTTGDQLQKALTDLLTEAADTDLGYLYESRNRLALAYRTRLSLANQTAAATLSHSSHELGETLHPTSDDQQLVNEQYVIRDKGIKAYKAKTTGKLKNTSPKQGGVGSYAAEKTVSVTYDQQVSDQVDFRLFLGTQDKPRYPQVTVNLHHPSIAGTSLETDLLAIDVGDRLVITDMPAYLPPDDVDLLVIGYSERFDQKTHTITFNCLPYEPWNWAVIDDTDKRVNTAGSTTTADFVSGTDTSMTVATSTGPVWMDSATYSSDFPFHIRVAGVVLNVTAISGTTSPQTFTVSTTVVNGVAKTIPSGSAVEVENKAYLGMV